MSRLLPSTRFPFIIRCERGQFSHAFSGEDFNFHSVSPEYFGCTLLFCVFFFLCAHLPFNHYCTIFSGVVFSYALWCGLSIVTFPVTTKAAIKRNQCSSIFPLIGGNLDPIHIEWLKFYCNCIFDRYSVHKNITLCQARWIQSMISHVNSLRPILLLFSHLHLSISSGVFSSDFPTKLYLCINLLLQ
jgi:hypothetical protein